MKFLHNWIEYAVFLGYIMAHVGAARHDFKREEVAFCETNS